MYYNNGVGAYAAQISRQKGDPIAFFMVTMGGAGLDWHRVKDYLRPEAAQSPNLADAGEDRDDSRQAAKERGYDAVVLQDRSRGPIDSKLSKLFREYAAIHCEDIRRAGAFPLLMMTWAYADKPEMTARLADATLKVANENKAMVVPVGLAFANALKGDPGIRLTVSDKRHPTPAGTYLEACVIYATLTGKSPEGAKRATIGDVKIPGETAAYLQKIAWETTRDFFGWK